METYKFKLRVAEDGILKIEFPSGLKNTDVEVLVVVQPQTMPSSPKIDNTMDRIRRQHARAYEPWTEAEERQLIELRHAGHTLQQLADALKRQPSAIRSRLDKIDANDFDKRNETG